MKRCATPSRPERLPDAARPRTAHSCKAAFALVALPLLGACVTSGTHDSVVQERDTLTAEVKRQAERIDALETSNAALSAELESTLDEFEDLNVQHETAVDELGALRAAEEQLAAAVTETSLELVRSQEELEVATAEVDRLTSTYTALMSDLESEVASGEIQIEQLKEGIRVNVSQDILFASGSARLDQVGEEVLGRVAEQLKDSTHQIEVQGHTDDRRISVALAKRYPTNWELASARASRVVRLMLERGVPGERLKVASFASYRPVAPNESPETRAQNRRIEIRLKPQEKPDDESVAVRSGAGD